VLDREAGAGTDGVALAKEAAEKNLAADAIKKAVKKWKADTYRV
jgi:hypothetical protein